MRNSRRVAIDRLQAFERDYSDAGLLTRYARGRRNYLVTRLLLALLACSLLAIFDDLVTGVFALSLGVIGEIVEFAVLARVHRWQGRGVPHRRIYRITAVSAAFQATTIAACIMITWFGEALNESHLFMIGFLTGAAINAGLALPYHKTAGLVRLWIYGLCGLGLFAVEFTHFNHVNEVIALNLVGAIMFGIMIIGFLNYVNRGFERNRLKERELLQQSVALEETNEVLRTREQQAYQLSLVARHANDSVILSDHDGRVTWVNQAFTRITGYSEDEVVGIRPAQLLNSPRTDPGHFDAIARAVRTGQPFRGEILNRTKDGRDIWIETNLVPVRDSAGEVDMTLAIERDITQSKEHARQLAEAKHAAEDAAQAKSDFLAAMSHEIRTPMNGVIGMADLLCELDLEDEARLYANTIRNSSQALLTLINDILDVSKIDANKMSLNPIDYDLRACVMDVVNLLGPQAKSKGLNVVLDWDVDVPDVVHGDDGRMRQVLVNLIGNAIKFTDTGQVALQIHCETDGQGHLLTVAVQDTGTGIPADKLETVFDRFEQARDETNRRYGGTGLGLTISKLLVEAMGGQISATSTLGEGSCFTFSAQLQVAQDRRCESGNSQEPTGPALQDLAGMRVLVAEDNAVNRLLIAKFMKKAPVDLQFAHDGQQAIELSRNWNPHVVFMDVAMPKISGLDATRRIREWKGPQPVIYALTAHAFESDRDRCLEVGMDGFLTKPIRRATLLNCLAQHRPRMAS